MSVYGEGVDWVTETMGAIKKANLIFMAKFLLLITAADNIVTWDRAVLIVAMIARFEVDFSWLLQVVIHDGILRLEILTLSQA